MGAHKKTGSHYFSMNVDFFSDKKIKRLRAAFGSDGVLTYIYLLCEIYRNGYYIEYDDDLILDISDELNIAPNLTRQIMNYLLSRSLFDKTLAESVKVLTAQSVQTRYQTLVKSRALKNPVWVDGKFWLLSKEETESFIKVYPSENNSVKNDDNSENYTDNSENCAPKGKVSKESNVCNVGTRPPEPTEKTDSYGQHRHIKLTTTQYNELISKYGKSIILEYIDKIDEYVENSGKKPFSNHFSTILKWLGNDGVEPKSAHSFDLDKLVEHAYKTIPKMKY